MHVAVVGAGLLGLTTAHFLRQAGAAVTVYERQPGPGLETSFANGGMLHASQASPWNEPGVLRRALAELGRDDAALLVRPRALPGMLRWAWAFLRQSRPANYLANVEKNARLAGYSLGVLVSDFGELAPAFERATLGTLKIYRSVRELEVAALVAERCRAWSVHFDVLDAAGVVAREPALAAIAGELAGGIHFPDDVSGDAHLFCRALAASCAAAGVAFEYECNVGEVLVRQGRCEGLVVDGSVARCDAVVIAAGSHTPALARSAGLRVPVQPVKGYSITVPLAGWATVPRVPVIDEHYHAAVCPLGGRLRVAGTAEFAGYDLQPTAARIDNLFHLLGRIYPAGRAGLARREAATWCGLRPMSPDGVGIMGATPVAGLYLNTGHGHLGWTMAPGAGKLVAGAVLGVAGDLALEDYSLARFH